MSARSETLEGIDPEERAWLASYLDVFAKKYAHELAEKQREFAHGTLKAFSEQERVAVLAAADLIDPEVADG